MRSWTHGLIAAAFLFGLTTADVDARSAKRHAMWNDGKHHHLHHRKKRVKHHRKIRKPLPPPIVVARVNIASQTLSLSVNGWPVANWLVSTGRTGFETPRGSFRAGRMAKVYYSRKYDNSPMPHSVFFYGGFAVHGTYHLRNLGRPASHGCIRLSPSNAAQFYNYVQHYGQQRTRIVIN